MKAARVSFAFWYDEDTGIGGISIAIETDNCTTVLSVNWFGQFEVVGCSCCH